MPSAPAIPVDDLRRTFAALGKTVLTFTGNSATGYEDEPAMLAAARRVLARFDPATTVVNIGATAEGIGAVYEIAKEMGFTTTGIVSTQARDHGVEISPHADRVFFVEDETWGGLLPGTERLSPTSEAMVAVSDRVVGIGGGEVSRDEMTAARRAGKPVEFIPAEMSHEAAVEKARKKGLPPPSDFRGAAHEVFASGGAGEAG